MKRAILDYQERFHVRSDLHLVRKAWHMLMGLCVAFIYYGTGMSIGTAMLILGSVLAFDLLLETARLKSHILNSIIVRFWGPIMRSREVRRFSTIPHYVIAAILVIAIFPKPVAVLSILYLACGDPMASLFGILYGGKSARIAPGKSLVGTVAGVVTCFIVSLLFLNTLGLSAASLIVLSIIGGIAGGTAELVPLDIDDNFTIPVVSGFVLWLAFILLGI